MSATNPSKSAPENLEAGAATYRQRQQAYGRSYIKFGAVMAALFPRGLDVPPDDVGGWIRLGILVQIITKLTRYVEQLPDGGHQDSAHDMMVYAAILEEVTASKSVPTEEKP